MEKCRTQDRDMDERIPRVINEQLLSVFGGALTSQRLRNDQAH